MLKTRAVVSRANGNANMCTSVLGCKLDNRTTKHSTKAGLNKTWKQLLFWFFTGAGNSHWRRSDLSRDGVVLKENNFHGTDFFKPWASNDAIFVVEEQRFHVHRWSSKFEEKTKTEIALPGKKNVEFQALMLMVYSLAKDCFSLATES